MFTEEEGSTEPGPELRAKTELQVMVTHFNKCFHEWSERYGTSANFNWSYVGGKKTFLIDDISKLIYRKPPSDILERMGVVKPG